MLLRRITQHIKGQNWFAVGIDFMIVVVGILLAFQITEWNEASKDRLREGVYLNRIAVELDESIASIEDAISLAERRAALGELLVRAADDPDVVPADPGRLVFALLKGGYTYSPDIRGHTFEEIKSVGALGVLRDEQVRPTRSMIMHSTPLQNYQLACQSSGRRSSKMTAVQKVIERRRARRRRSASGTA